MSKVIENRYTVTEMVALRPDKLVFYKKFNKNFATFLPKNVDDKKSHKRAVAINKHNFELSTKASLRIKEKISWLYELSKKKSIVLDNGKKSFDFKLSFITLTLPFKQSHTTSELTSKCLHNFFSELTALHGLKNYVWRLEFQKNGNAHYHICCDVFVPLPILKDVWNRSINRLGYVQKYAEKSRVLTCAEYIKKYHIPNTNDYKLLALRYAFGKNTDWLEPNTVDVRVVTNNKKIAYYISKYITKQSEHGLNSIVASREAESTNLRLWFCSRGLSKCKSVVMHLEYFSKKVDGFFENLSKVTTYVHDYCTVSFFNKFEQSAQCKRYLWLIFNEYSESIGYIKGG